MSTSKTYAVAIVCGGHPHVFAQNATSEVAATIDALQALYTHLSDHDDRYDFYEKCLPFCEWLEAQNFTTLEALQNAIDEASEDAPESIRIGHYTEEVISLWQHGFECGKLRDGQHSLMRERNHWRDRAFQMLNAAKGYRESYLHSCDKWVVLREQYNEMQDYYDAMQREAREQLAKARILQIGFIAAGIGLGLIIHHLIF